MQTAVKIRNTLVMKGIKVDEEEKGGTTWLRLYQPIKGSSSIPVAFSTNNSSIVRVFLMNYVYINNPERKGKVYELMNEANRLDMGTLYVHTNNYIECQYAFFLPENNNGQMALEVLVSLLDVLDYYYPKFMKLLWSNNGPVVL